MNKRIAICGAGIAGIATAYYITQLLPSIEIVLIDRNQPLSYTSSKSGENFRDYWPHPSMEALSSHSIDLMQNLLKKYGETAFRMEFSGYHFVSCYADKPIFADDNAFSFRQRNKVITNTKVIRQQYPYLSPTIQKSILIKKAGNVDSISMANLMLKVAKDNGAVLVEGIIEAIHRNKRGFGVSLADQQNILVDKVIIAAGPFINHIGNMMGVKFPIWNTLQRKFLIPDPLQIIPVDMPFTIFADGQFLDWSAEEKDFFESDEKLQWLNQVFPGAIHIKPDSGRIKMGWAFSKEAVEPELKIPMSPYFPQVVLKGATRFIPALTAYAEHIPTPLIEYGGYYTRTKENWPLIGPTSEKNVYVVGALAGFGSMTACAAGELLALYIAEKELPTYASYFHSNRYDNPYIQQELANLNLDGQL